MSKTNQIKKVINGEIADADDINQIVEDAGNEGGGIPYDPTSHQRSTDGSQSLGSTAFPWGSLKINQEAELVEVDAVNHTAASSILIKNLRKFTSLKDVPSSYAGKIGFPVRVNPSGDGLEFSQGDASKLFVTSGTWTVPAGINLVFVTGIGAGGGGGGTYNDDGGGGGGAGASGIKIPYAVTPGATITVTVGAKGTGGAVGENPGTAGGSSSFGTLTFNGGGGGSNAATKGAGGAGVTQTQATGSTGGSGSTIAAGGNGADGVLGGGKAGGGGGICALNLLGGVGGNGATSAGAGGDATGYGNGGGGAYAPGGGNPGSKGGDGSQGLIYIEW